MRDDLPSGQRRHDVTLDAAPLNPSAGAATPVAITIWTHITPTLERDFIRRGVFPELRLSNAIRRTGETGRYRLTADQAQEVLTDAEGQYLDCAARGLKVAYGALTSRLRGELALSEDEPPGHGGSPADSLARFSVGDEVLYFADGDPDGEPAVIVEDYSLACAVCEADGVSQYRPGYVVEMNSTQYYCPAYRLRLEDRKPSHIRLVSSRPAPCFELQGGV